MRPARPQPVKGRTSKSPAGMKREQRAAASTLVYWPAPQSGRPSVDAAPRTSILIPAYDEAATIGQVVTAARRVQQSLGSDSELLVIDDGSRDDTGRIGAEARARGITP